MRFILLKFFILFLVFVSALFSKDLFDDVSNKLTKDTKKVTLTNGLTLIMMRRTSSPTLALYIKFKVGSVDEVPEQAGTAHLLEHMMFKGTKNLGTKDYAKEEKYQELLKFYGSELDRLKMNARRYSQIGEEIPEEIDKQIKEHEKSVKVYEDIQKKYIIKSEDNLIYTENGQVGFNAYTTNDVTNYQIQLPANRLELWAKIESDRLENPILREYYTEREVIMEERRMRVENRGFGLLRERFLSIAFEQHPYRKPVIGYPSNIPFLDIYQTEDFFRSYYTPDNMVISIVGDLSFDETETIVKRYFSSLKPSKKRDLLRVEEKSGTGEKRFSIKFASSPILMMGWHKPTFPHPDNSVFDVIDVLLTGGADSRLFKRLVLEEKLAQSVDAWNGDPGDRYSNLFTIIVRPNSNADVNKIETIVNEEIDKLKNGKIIDTEILVIKNKLVADFFRGLDNNATLADTLSYYELLTGDWANLFRSYKILYTITINDIKRASSKY